MSPLDPGPDSDDSWLTTAGHSRRGVEGGKLLWCALYWNIVYKSGELTAEEIGHWVGPVDEVFPWRSKLCPWDCRYGLGVSARMNPYRRLRLSLTNDTLWNALRENVRTDETCTHEHTGRLYSR